MLKEIWGAPWWAQGHHYVSLFLNQRIFRVGNLRIFFRHLEEIEVIDKRKNPARKVQPVKAAVKIEVFTVQKMLRHTELSMTIGYVNLFRTALKEQNGKFNPLNGVEL